MKSLKMFLKCVLNDMGTWCRISTSHDLKKIEARIEHEGLSFLTITLPNFGKDFEKSLDQGFVSDDLFSGFHRASGLPQFLGGFLRLVFDFRSGRLLEKPSIDAIHAVRQVTLMFAKMNLPCSDARRDAAIEAYIQCEQDVRDYDRSTPSNLLDDFDRISSLLWGNVFSEVDRKLFFEGVIPKHGPGATADRLRGNAKWDQQEWTERLEQMFPHWEHLVPSPSPSALERLTDVRILEPGAERPARVITVPKTLKSPRIIAIEPTCMQYMQQGLLECIREAVEADHIASGLVGWSSQVPNQHLAREGSKNGKLATLDLREASDRVSNQHVLRLLRNHTLFRESVAACRTRKADVPGYRGNPSRIIRLAKFASMGSALCFPMEAFVFATIIFVGIQQELNRPLTRKDIESLSGKVRVFGDDIIVPVDYVQTVIETLHAFGLVVNSSKSFWSGKFRESCGKDYYDGHDVSIVRLRNNIPSSLTDVQEIVSTVSTRNQFYLLGMWETAAYLDSVLGDINFPFPRVAENSPILGRTSFLGPESTGKLDPNLHVPLVRGYVVSSRSPVSKLDDYPALLKCLTQMELRRKTDPRFEFLGLPPEKDSHLERQGRPQTVDIKLRWAPAA